MASLRHTAPGHSSTVAIRRAALLPTEADVREYGGFWRRVGAALLDALILSPMAIALMIALNYTHLAYVYYVLPAIAISLVYRVYLVQRFGGTPGKRILHLRITNLDDIAAA